MKTWSFVIILLLLLSGCGTEEPGAALDLSTAQSVPISEVERFPLISHSTKGVRASDSATRNLPAEDGMFLLQETDLDGPYYLLFFYDYVSHEAYPTCIRANCMHNTTDCPAMLRCRGLIHYDGSWIYYRSSQNGADTIIRQKADGSERETIFESAKINGRNSIARIDAAVWQDGFIYFEMSGTLFDQNTGEVTTGEQICCLDVKTGDIVQYSELRDENQKNDLYLEGIYGDNLILRYNEIVHESLGKEEYHETYFMFHVETAEIKILISGDQGPGGLYGAYQHGFEDGILIFQSQSEQDSMALPVYGCAGRTVFLCHCERFVFDLEQGCGYILASEDYVCNRDEIGGGYLIHFVPDEAKTAAMPMFYNLQTGEEARMPNLFPEYDWYHFTAQGDYFLLRLWQDNHMIGTIYIRRDDFWSGKAEYHFFPEWASVS